MMPLIRRFIGRRSFLSAFSFAPVGAQVDTDRYSGEQIQRDLDSLADWI